MKAVRKWQGLATLGSVVALAIGAAALIPASSVASVTHACGNHTVLVELETEPGKPKTKFKLPVKQIVTKGVSCTAAYKFLNALYTEQNGKTPEGFKCTGGKFKVPRGSVPTVCTKSGGKKIQYAGQGG